MRRGFGTVGQMYWEDSFGGHSYFFAQCERCHRRTEFDLRGLAVLLGPDYPVADFIERLRCHRCGARGDDVAVRGGYAAPMSGVPWQPPEPDISEVEMCGRFTRNYTWRQIHAMYSLNAPASNLQPRFNICPTTPIDAVTERDGKRILATMRWGLVPYWFDKPLRQLKLATFNARAETVATKPVFRTAFQKTRCLIPASGYYEWQYTPGGKQPWYFTRRDGDPVTIAGIWERWKNPEDGQVLESCAMVICEPNAFVAEVHDRMPVVLEPDSFQTWLTGEAPAAASLMAPAAESILQKWPVSKRVNSSRADDSDPTLTEAVDLTGPGAPELDIRQKLDKKSRDSG